MLSPKLWHTSAPTECPANLLRRDGAVDSVTPALMRTSYPHHSKLKRQWPAPWVVVRDQAPLSNTAEDDVE